MSKKRTARPRVTPSAPIMYNETVERSSGRKPTFLLHEMPVIGKEETIAKITEIAERVAGSEGLEIVEVQLLGAGRGRVLRIFIDRLQGVSHADCEFISQHVGTILDVEDVIPGDTYTLEVSSPGLERKLHKAKDFERFLGQKAKVVLREPVENQRSWVGKLAGFSEGIVTLEPSAGKTVRFALTQVEKANLKFEW
jgi:ribosome maturation factor RimP